MTLPRLVFAAALCFVLTPVTLHAQDLLRLVPGALSSDSALDAAMPQLARAVLAAYVEPDLDRRLDNTVRLRIAADDYATALELLAQLRQLRGGNRRPPSPWSMVAYEIFAAAKNQQGTLRVPLDSAVRNAFRESMLRTDDRAAAHQVRYALGTAPQRLRRELDAARERLRGATSVSLVDGLDLARKYVAVRAYEVLATSSATLLDEDDERRYVIDRNILVTTGDGARICALTIRPRQATGRLTALLNFTIYADSEQNSSEARRTASHGYVGVEGLTRGKACSPESPVSHEHDGADADALIAWIVAQPWSDGRVGMYGGSYEGFTQWAAAKHLPPALKAIMPSVTHAPGIDFPMDGGIWMNYAYPWPLYTTTTKTLDNRTYYDADRWQRLNRSWYTSGRPYNELEQIDRHPNPVFMRWLQHPDYDDYWRRMIPYREEFARINIPVLTTTGYYDGGQLGALYYFAEHYKYNPRAEHYFIIGPYDHISGQRGTITPLGRTLDSLGGYALDPVAHLDIGELRYEWFDHVFRGKPIPALLQDRVNYQVMGANTWRHAPSIEAMHESITRLYLSTAGSGPSLRLATRAPRHKSVATISVDLADRTDVDQPELEINFDWPRLLDSMVNVRHGVRFVSEPFTTPTEVSGLLSGHLAFVTNKRDFDVAVTLYEQTADDKYFVLTQFLTRASYARNRSARALLHPGRDEMIDFQARRLISKLLSAGSRVVVALNVLKQSSAQINYGSGRVVSEESSGDSGAPLKVQWLSGSFISLPIGPRVSR